MALGHCVAPPWKAKQQRQAVVKLLQGGSLRSAVFAFIALVLSIPGFH